MDMQKSHAESSVKPEKICSFLPAGMICWQHGGDDYGR